MPTYPVVQESTVQRSLRRVSYDLQSCLVNGMVYGIGFTTYNLYILVSPMMICLVVSMKNSETMSSTFNHRNIRRWSPVKWRAYCSGKLKAPTRTGNYFEKYLFNVSILALYIYINNYIYIYIYLSAVGMDQKPWDPVAHLPIWHHGKNIGTQTSSLPMGRCDLIFVQIVYWGSSLDRGSLDWLCILAFMLSWQISPDLGREAEGSQKVLRCIMWIMWSMYNYCI